MAVCNGEIDNHRELRKWLAERGRPVQRETDVAVIPGLYLELGEAFVSKLIGAFAIAVWDPRSRRLTLARDRAGERPLFYAMNGNEIIFATEIAALVAHRRLPVNLDQQALRKYLQFGIFPSPDTPFAEIRKVAPGELIQLDAAGVRRNPGGAGKLRRRPNHRHHSMRSIKRSVPPSAARATWTWISGSF